MLIFVFGIWACQNRVQVPKSESMSKSPSLVISSISYGTDPTAVKWYEYNQQGDLIRQGMLIDTIVFEYFENKIVRRHLNKKLSLDATTEYFIDNTGRVISSNLYDEKNKEISWFQYFYDDNGYLIKTVQQTLATGAQYISNNVYESGNLKEVISYNTQGEEESKYVYEYYPDQPDDFNLDIHEISENILPNERLGKRNKNMVSQITNITNEGDTLAILKYKYNVVDKNSKMICYQSDVLNGFDIDISYHFHKR